MTDVRGAVRHAGHSRSKPVGYPGRRMIEHDCNPAARQASYPVGAERDPDPPALEQGAGRDLTRRPYLAAAATPRGFNRAGVGLMAGYGLAAHWHIRHPCDWQEPLLSGRSHAHLPPEDHKTLRITALARFSSRLSGAAQMHR